MFVSARDIQQWLLLCARAVAKVDKPVQWTTPLGLPVVQPYRKKVCLPHLHFAHALNQVASMVSALFNINQSFAMECCIAWVRALHIIPQPCPSVSLPVSASVSLQVSLDVCVSPVHVEVLCIQH